MITYTLVFLFLVCEKTILFHWIYRLKQRVEETTLQEERENNKGIKNYHPLYHFLLFHNLIHDEQLQGHKSGTNLNSRPKQQVP